MLCGAMDLTIPLSIGAAVVTFVCTAASITALNRRERREARKDLSDAIDQALKPLIDRMSREENESRVLHRRLNDQERRTAELDREIVSRLSAVETALGSVRSSMEGLQREMLSRGLPK